MKTPIRYLLLTLAFLFLASGVVVAAFLDTCNSLGYGILWLLVPMTALFMLGVVVNDCIYIPRLLITGRYGCYCVTVCGTCYLLSLMALLLEYCVRSGIGLSMRINNYASPWILIDAFSNSVLLSLILLGLGLMALYQCWSHELEEERALSAALERYIKTVSDRLNLRHILSLLQLTASSGGNDMIVKIRELSEYLRTRLYGLPSPPQIAIEPAVASDFSRLTNLLVSPRYRILRHLLFIFILLIISFGTFFNAPDQPEFTANRLGGAMTMFGVLAFLAYINILWLYPAYMRHGNLKKYVVSVVILLLVFTLPLILVQILTFELNVYDKCLPMIVVFLSTGGSVLTLFFFIGGISAVLLLQNWIQTRQRMTLLRAETVRQEYACLRKQINPHFLFNVLNNIGVTAYDEPELAVDLLDDLQALFKYQLKNLRCESTALCDECAFIKSYFALESTRRDRFEYSLSVDCNTQNLKIPTLLFIPFIENAVKYSSPLEGTAKVDVHFSQRGKMLSFVCKNTYDFEKVKKMRPGGIGIANTLKRLGYLYDEKFTYRCVATDKTYIVELTIPLK